jgi:DNA-binding beta-propeller fold protein YncE
VVAENGSRLLVGDPLGPSLADPEGESVVLDAATGSVVRRLEGTAGALTGDGTLAATAHPGLVRVTDLATGEVAGTAVTALPVPSPVMSFDPAGVRLAVADLGDRRVHVFDWRTGAEVAAPVGSLGQRPLPGFLADGRLFARSISRAALVDLAAPAVAPIAHTIDAVGFVGFTPDGRRVVSNDPTGKGIVLWDAEDGTRAGELRVPPDPGESRVVPSPDGRTLFVLRPGGIAELRTRASAELLGTFVHPARVNAVWSSDSSAVALAYNDGEVRVWPVSRAAREPMAVKPVGDPDPGLQQLTFSPDGRRLLVIRESAGMGTVFDARSGARRTVVRLEPGFAMRGAAYRPDGRAIAVATENEADASGAGAILVLDAVSGAVLDQLPVEHQLNGITYYDDGRRLATVRLAAFSNETAPGSSALELWDADRLVPIGDPAPYPAGAFVPFSSPDGTRVLMPTDTGDAVLWEVDPAAWARLACGLADRPLTRSEWRQYLPGLAYDPACR